MTLALEALALHHPIAVLERSRARRPRFRRWDRLFWIFLSWILLSWWWAGWRESLLNVQPQMVFRWRRSGCPHFRDIVHAVAGDVGGPGFLLKSVAWTHRWLVRTSFGERLVSMVSSLCLVFKV